jgi:hypothetical protein
VIETAPVTLTLSELWLLHAFIRHEMPQQEQWKLPPTDLDLNEQIAFAIMACEEGGLHSYTLAMTVHQLLCVDYWIRDEHKTVTGARGKDILIKTFRARRSLSGELPVPVGDTPDATYTQALSVKGIVNASPNDHTSPNTGHQPTDTPGPIA